MLISIIFSIIIILAFYGGANYYVALRIYQWLSMILANINTKLYIGIYVFIALSLLLRFAIAFLSVNGRIKRVINWMSSYWMGVFIYLLTFLFIADLVILLGRGAGVISTINSQYAYFYLGLGVILLSFISIIYGMYNAGKIKSVAYDIKTNKNSLQEEIKIALISDLHLGSVNSEKGLEKIVHKINDLDSDIVCIAGDIFDNDYYAIQNPSKAIDLLKSIKSTNCSIGS